MSEYLPLLLRNLQLVQHELLVFAMFWLIVGMIDEAGIDLAWIWLKLTGRISDTRLPAGLASRPLSARAAVLIPAWQEAEVIGATVSHMLSAWAQRELTIYVGCYRNDPATLSAAMVAAAHSSRVRLVIHGNEGPTTKADCLNRLYRALCDDEGRQGAPFGTVVLHDAEDMVHPAELAVIDQALAEVDFVQLPVRPEPQVGSRWIAGHYADEFSEAHAKALVVRDVLGAGIPAAGVGCGFARAALARIADMRRADGSFGPFAADSLAEDYEVGMLLSRQSRGSRFVRLRDEQGELVATRSYFPADLGSSVRQKTRWIHGIALQGWERLGWSGRPIDVWMVLRDRRGPLTAMVLAAAYALLLIDLALRLAEMAGAVELAPPSHLLSIGITLTAIGLLWRAVMRIGFTGAEYGWAEGLRAVLRMPVANVIAIMAGRRALVAYVRCLFGGAARWDKTVHLTHPAKANEARLAA